MQISTKLWIIAGLAALGASGCASHRDVETVTYQPPSSFLSAASDRERVRVYSKTEPAVTGPVVVDAPAPLVRTTVPLIDVVRQAVEEDAMLNDACRNVDIAVRGSHLVLRGGVPTDHDRHFVESRLRHLPGVTVVENHLQTENR